ncbi:unnamed protein product [Symbiodinium natans]|uniref:Uncharacterized protein n=1 Tax=Symbiodinium natans TaxID=878477 RepID=A0A812KJM3_9DINO|nr:unnamed protein product [Symbiodinium natans]
MNENLPCTRILDRACRSLKWDKGLDSVIFWVCSELAMPECEGPPLIFFYEIFLSERIRDFPPSSKVLLSYLCAASAIHFCNLVGQNSWLVQARFRSSCRAVGCEEEFDVPSLNVAQAPTFAQFRPIPFDASALGGKSPIG